MADLSSGSMKRVTGIGGICTPSLKHYARKAATFARKIDDSEYGKFGWVIDPREIRSNFGNRPGVNDPFGMVHSMNRLYEPHS